MAGNYDGYVRINTQLNTKDFNKSASGITAGLGKIAKAAAVAFSVGAIVKFGKECIELSSDLAEVDNVVSKAFGSMRGEMDALADTAIKKLGMSRLTAYQTGSTFMSMGRSMLDSSEDAKTMALELTKLTGNMASFYNKSQDLVSLALKSVYTGETETLKQYGIVMTEVNLKQFAMEQGIKKAYNQMTQSEKVMLRYQYVMQQTAFIGDDFADTQDSWANQTRILKEQWKEFMLVIGNGLVTVLTPVIKTINGIVGSLITFANAVSAVLSSVFGLKKQTLGVASATNDTASAYSGAADSVGDYSEATEDAGKASEKAGKEAKKATANFDDLNQISNPSSSDSGSGSGSGADGGAGGGAGGGGGSIGSAIESLSEEPDTSWLDNLQGKFAPLIESINRFKDSLEPLKTFVATGLKDFYNDCLVPIGNWVMGEGLPRFINGLTKFNNGVDWQKINKALDDLWKALTPFAINVGEGLLWFYENVLVPLATWTVSEVLPEFLNILAGALKIINEAINSAKPLWSWLWDNFLEPIAKWTGGVIVDVLNGIGDALNKIGDWMSENQTVVTVMEGAILGFFAAWEITKLLGFIEISGGLVAAFTSLTGAIASCTVAKIADKLETMAIYALYAKDLVVGIGQAVASFVALTAAKVADAAETAALYALYAGDFIKSIVAQGAALVTQGAQWVATTALKIADTVATTAAAAATWALNTALTVLTSPITLVIVAIAGLVAAGIALYKNWDTVSQFASEVWGKIKTTISNAINAVKTAITNALTAIKTKWDSVWTALHTKVSSIWDFIKTKVSDTVENIRTAISDTVDKIKEKWDKVWDNVWNKVKTIWDNIAEHIKGVVNTIIGVINGMINAVEKGVNAAIHALNKISFDTPDWLPPPFGGKHFGFNLDDVDLSKYNIKPLAKGGVIPPNSPFLAMLGDQKSGTNIETPLDTMVLAFKNALKDSDMGGRGSATVIMEVDKQEFGRAVVKFGNKETQRVGISLI